MQRTLAVLAALAAYLAAATPIQVHGQTLLVPTRTHWGTNGYIEYVEGNLPLVLSAPHGGYLKPTEIPDRTYGVTIQDRRTQELARAWLRAFRDRTGRQPHLILCHLHRIKLDANRDIIEAAQGNKIAEQAWREYHTFIDRAKAAVDAHFGAGYYIDIHGHSHPVDWVELGYLLSAGDLALPDTALRNPAYINKSSIRALALKPGVDFPEVLRGQSSLGARLALRGYRTVPSPADPSPGTQGYFMGGYNTVRHGSRDSGTIDGTQFEHPWSIRQNAATRETFSKFLAEAMDLHFAGYYRIALTAHPRVSVTAVDPYASEAGGGGGFRFTRTGNLLNPMTVRFVLAGTAVEGTDFASLPRSVVIPALKTTADLLVLPLDDSLAEGRETVHVLIEGGREPSHPTCATVIIADDEGDPHLQGVWTLDAVAGGLAPDTSGRGRHARGLPPGGRGPGVVPGVHGNALQFDEIDDHLRLHAFPYASCGTFTLAFWFRVPPSTQQGYQNVFSQGTYNTPESLSIYFSEATGLLRTHLVYKNNRVENGPLDVTWNTMDGKWHHYCLTAHPTDLTRIYIDGKVQAEALYAGDTFNPTGDIFFGARSDLSPTRYYSGALDDIRLLSRSLSAREMTNLHAFEPGSIAPFGQGCKGNRRDVPLQGLRGSPELGDRLAFTVSQCPAYVQGLLVVGLSRDFWRGHALPLDFTPLGAPGCSLYVSLDSAMSVLTSATGKAEVWLWIPYEPSLLGVKAYSQFFLFDPPANVLGLISSAALELRLGGIR